LPHDGASAGAALASFSRYPAVIAAGSADLKRAAAARDVCDEVTSSTPILIAQASKRSSAAPGDGLLGAMAVCGGAADGGDAVEHDGNAHWGEDGDGAGLPRSAV